MTSSPELIADWTIFPLLFSYCYRFEREYPGRRRRTPDAKENVDVPVNQRSVRKSKDRGGAGRDYDGRVINRSSSYGKSTVTDGYLGGSEDDYDLDD